MLPVINYSLDSTRILSGERSPLLIHSTSPDFSTKPISYWRVQTLEGQGQLAVCFLCEQLLHKETNMEIYFLLYGALFFIYSV